MSQGELHALALAIFLPRATLPASPFRFVIIDDPVQSMDPSRIDGLARVLESVARDRQVIVFTHDPRLTEAVHRLQIPAQVVGVTRRPGSRVELHEESDASSRALADADAVARTADLAPEVATTVVAGLCREAIEATCTQQVRRVRLGRGETHESVADLVAAAPTTNQMMALALHGDAQAGGRVLPTLGQWGRELADVYQWCRKEAHGAGGSVDLVDRVRLARRLVDRLRGRG